MRLRAPRALTQAISRYLYERSGPEGRARFAGIRYASRLGDELVNWAIFEPTRLERARSQPLQPDDPDLGTALARLGLVIAPQA